LQLDLALLKAEKLVKRYHGKPVVDKVSIELSDQSIVGLLGPNGAGKTTTFYMIAGLIPADEGVVYLNNEDITRLPLHKRARKGITYLPQETSVFRRLSVADNIRLVLELKGFSGNDLEDRMRELLDEMDLAGIADQQASSLSGGQQRRVEVLRSLATDPEFILLDEPFAGVDPLAISDLQQIIRRLRDRGIGVFISDHNVREILTVCDHAYIVNSGVVIEQGNPDHIASSDIARKIYLGEDFRL